MSQLSGISNANPQQINTDNTSNDINESNNGFSP